MARLWKGFPTLLIGGIMLTLAISLGIVGANTAADEAAQAEKLQPMSLGRFEDSPLQNPALIEGILSPRNPVVLRNFVAYTSEEYHGRDRNNNELWRESAAATPPLLVDLPGGLISIRNSDYRLSGAHETWQDSDLFWNNSEEVGTKRYSGLTSGGTVMAIGRVMAGPEGPVLEAAIVYGGSRAAYIAERQRTAWMFRLIGVIFGVIGGILLLISAWIVVRGR